jgi:CheY-like chemotaxis protein
VLIVEDDHDLGEIFADVLRSEGWAVDVARDGQAALEMLEAGLEPCVTVADLRMPRMDGWELTRRLRESSKWAGLPLVIVAAHIRIADEARKLGVRWWLQKPVSIDRLVEVVSEACLHPQATE